MFHRNKKGITLVELIVTIGALTLLFSMTVPKISKGRFYLLTVSRELRNDIRNIRYEKMAEGRNYKIAFEKRAYRLSEGPKIKKKVQLAKGYYIAQNFKDGEILFAYSGAPATSGGTIYIIDEDTNRHCEITVVPDTGRVLFKDRVLEGYKP